MAQTLTSLRGPKRTVLLVAGVFSALLGALIVLPAEAGHLPLIRLTFIIGISLLVLAWCHFDSVERHQSIYPWLRIVIVFFGLFALFIYLFKSRGFKQGMRSSGLALLSLSGLFAILLSSSLLCALVFDIE